MPFWPLDFIPVSGTKAVIEITPPEGPERQESTFCHANGMPDGAAVEKAVKPPVFGLPDGRRAGGNLFSRPIWAPARQLFPQKNTAFNVSRASAMGRGRGIFRNPGQKMTLENTGIFTSPYNH